MSPFGLAGHVLEQILGVLRDHPLVERAVIYGSRATGTFKPHSDIDIAFYAPSMEDAEAARLRFELRELPIVFKVDAVHVERLGNAALRDKIVREGKALYP